jgi:hypothetical protein
MANEKIIFDTEVKVGSSVGSVKSLKAELRAITNELGTLEAGSEAFVKAAKKAGALKDQIGDVKNTINAFNPEAKFKALGDAVGIAANGFAAMQGAMAILGTENENLNKVIAQTQGAIALATGLNGLLGMKDAWSNLKLVAGDALKGIKAGIGATGIGLIVVAVGLLYANWELVSNAVKKSLPIFNDLGKVFDKLREVAYGAGEVIKNAILMPFKTFAKLIQGDFAGALEEVKKGYNVVENYKKGAEAGVKANEEAHAKEKLERLIKQKEKELEVEKAAGKDTYKNELALNKLKQELAKDDTKQLETLQQERKVLIAKHNKEIEDERKKAATEAKKKKEDEAKEDFEFYSNLSKEQYKKQAEIDKDAQILKNREQDKIASDIDAANKKQEIDDKKALEIHNETLKQTSTNERLSYDERLAAYKQMAAENLITSTQLKDAEIAIEKEKQAAKTAALQEGANVLNQAADLLGKNTAEGKALAVASATISTYLSAQKAFESFAGLGPIGIPLGIAAAGVAVAAGIANVNKILSTPVPGNSGGGGGGGGGITAPSAPRIPQSFTGTKLGGNSEVITKGNGQVQKVIVTETDITKTQDKVKGIIRKATIK